MASVLNRTTLEFYQSVNTPDYPIADWIINPDMSAVIGVDQQYWKLSGDTPIEMSQGEKDAVDAAALIASRDSIAAGLDEQENILRAFMLEVIDEFNILRNSAFGGLYVDAPQTAQSVPNNAWTALDALDAATAMPAGGGVAASGGVITLPTAGDWIASWSLSFSGASNTSYSFAAFGNAVQASETIAHRALGAGATDVGSITGHAIVNTPVPNVDLSLRVRQSEGGPRDVTIESLQLSVLGVADLAPRTTAQLRNAIRNRLGS